jgi:hypothetical protein
MAIFRWIEGWYNPRRIQENLGWRSPLEYEVAYAAAEDLSIPATAKPAPVLGAVKQTTLDGACGPEHDRNGEADKRMDYEERIDDPGTQLITASNKPGEGLSGMGVVRVTACSPASSWLGWVIAARMWSNTKASSASARMLRSGQRRDSPPARMGSWLRQW